MASLEKKITKEYQSTQKKITKLSSQKFKSDTEAELNLKLIQSKLKFHVINEIKIIQNQEQTYQIAGVIQANNDVIEADRRQLTKAQTGIPNQLGKLTDRPTLRWIFQCFQGIHLLVHQGIKQVVNLTKERQLTLKFFPLSCQQYYILSG